MMLAQYKGSGDEEAQRESIGTMLTFMLLLGVCLTIPCLIFARPLLNLLNTPAESMKAAFWYFILSAIGIVFIFGYNSVCAIMRGLGDSRRPMYFVAVSTVTNIVLDLIFVGALHWGAGRCGCCYHHCAGDLIYFGVCLPVPASGRLCV